MKLGYPLRLLCALGLLGYASLSLAHPEHHHHQHHHQLPASSEETAQGVRLVDRPLIDQHQRERRLPDDLLGDEPVVVGFVYTTCTTVCPVISAIMAKARDRLASDGIDARLLSITVDPLRDTPQRMAEMASRYEADEHWNWVTGTPDDIEAVLRGFRVYSANVEEHQPVIMVGLKGHWLRFYGFADPLQIVAGVKRLQQEPEAKLAALPVGRREMQP